MAIAQCLLFWLLPGSESRVPDTKYSPLSLGFCIGEDMMRSGFVNKSTGNIPYWSWMNIFKHRAVHFLIKNKLLPRPINIKRFFLSHEILIQGRMLKKLIPLSLRNFPLLSEPPHKNRPDPGISSRNHISSPSYISISFGEYFSCKKSLCRFVFIGQLVLSARRFVCRIWRAISVLSDVSFFTLAWEYSLSVLCLFKYCENKNLTLKLPEINISSFPNTFKTNWGKDNP